MRYFLLVFSVFLFQSAPAQSIHRLKIISLKKPTTESQRFMMCLANNYNDDLLPNYPFLDTIKHINALIRVENAIKFKGECDGIYYYLLRSEFWITPTFRGGYYDYAYLVILNNKIIPFKANDEANAAKFQRIRQDLIKNVGVQKTDSIRPHLTSGYAQF